MQMSADLHLCLRSNHFVQFIEVPKPRIFDCLTVFSHALEMIACSFHNVMSSSFINVPNSTVFAHSLESIASSFHKLTSKALVSFNTWTSGGVLWGHFQ